MRDVERKAEVSRDLYVRTDSQSLDTSVQKDSGTLQDYRQYVVVAALREAFRQVRRQTLSWIPTLEMVADPLTKWMYP